MSTAVDTIVANTDYSAEEAQFMLKNFDNDADKVIRHFNINGRIQVKENKQVSRAQLNKEMFSQFRTLLNQPNVK